jgi:hypothetical protein
LDVFDRVVETGSDVRGSDPRLRSRLSLRFCLFRARFSSEALALNVAGIIFVLGEYSAMTGVTHLARNVVSTAIRRCSPCS